MGSETLQQNYLTVGSLFQSTRSAIGVKLHVQHTICNVILQILILTQTTI